MMQDQAKQDEKGERGRRSKARDLKKTEREKERARASRTGQALEMTGADGNLTR
jgi:hypothetical protein